MNQKENRKEVEMVTTIKGGLGFVIVRYHKADDDDEL